MSYRIFRFGTLTLPVLEASHEVGAGASKASIIETPSGQVDLLGTERAARTMHTISYECRIYGTETSIQAQLGALKALRGTADRLYRRNADRTIHWTWARLDSVNATHGSRNGRNMGVMLNFIILSQTWNGDNHDGGWVLDDGEYLDYGLYLNSADFYWMLNTSPRTVTVTNGGNATARSCIVTVTAGSAAITALRMQFTGVDVNWSGTLASGDKLVIDCGARTVTNDGVDAYSGFVLGAGHVNEDWLPLAPGATDVTVTKTGGSTDSYILFEFYDAEE